MTQDPRAVARVRAQEIISRMWGDWTLIADEKHPEKWACIKPAELLEEFTQALADERRMVVGTIGGSADCYLAADEAVTLLRRQHADFVRLVKKLDAVEFKNMSYDFQAGQHTAYMSLLAALVKRKGGR